MCILSVLEARKGAREGGKKEMNACIKMEFIRVYKNLGLSKIFYMMIGASGALCE